MEIGEYVQHWNYFRALAERLDETRNYVYHGFQEDENGKFHQIHADVYSDNFKQIIVLAAAEFEVICKALCKERKRSVKGINAISKAVLEEFPKITETEIAVLFWGGTPLQEWAIDENGNAKGLKWWHAYNSLKHDRADSYKEATLENAVLSVSALYILNLYLMYESFHSLAIAYEFPPVYFKSKYTASPMTSGEGLLPDYGNKSPTEVIRDKFPQLFKDDLFSR